MTSEPEPSVRVVNGRARQDPDLRAQLCGVKVQISGRFQRCHTVYCPAKTTLDCFSNRLAEFNWQLAGNGICLNRQSCPQLSQLRF